MMTGNVYDGAYVRCSRLEYTITTLNTTQHKSLENQGCKTCQ